MNIADLEQLGLVNFSVKPEFDFISTDLPVDNVEDLTDSKVSCVLVAAGLSSIWQNESKDEWVLLENILQSIGLDADAVIFFDSEIIQTEEAIMNCIEEIIEEGVEFAFSFDENSELIKQLQEGLSIAFLPSLGEQLASANSKRDCYQVLKQYF